MSAESDDLVVPVETGTCVVFSNQDLVHRVDPLSKTLQAQRETGCPFKDACRVVLAFFLIDPAFSLKSTAVLGYRKLSLASERLRSALSANPTLRCLPIGVMSVICLFCGDAIDEDEARQTQQDLRQSRQARVWDAKMNDRRGHMDGWIGIDAGIMEFNGGDGIGVRC